VDQMRKRLLILIKETGTERLILLGDVKHKVPGITFQEMREVPELLGDLSSRVQIEIVPGNHDAGIAQLLPKNVKIHKTSGFAIGDTWLAHGQSWPGKGFLKSEQIIVGHDHPLVEIKDKIDYRFTEQIWVKADLTQQSLAKKYTFESENNLPKLIVMPAFNEFSGGIAINRKVNLEAGEKGVGLGPLVRSADLRNAEIYMLDGLLLGKLKDIMQN